MGRAAGRVPTVLCVLAVCLLTRPGVRGQEAGKPQELIITTFAGGSGFGYADGTGDGAKFLSPAGIAVDTSGNVYVADRANSVNNAASVKPFGTIDTPMQGEIVSGTIVNFGWALTPQPNTIPTDGSTIDVYVDGVFRGHPVYNNHRVDVATLFPGLNNSNEGGRLLHAGHAHAEQRRAHDRVGRAGQCRQCARHGQPVFHREELTRGR